MQASRGRLSDRPWIIAIMAVVALLAVSVPVSTTAHNRGTSFGGAPDHVSLLENGAIFAPASGVLAQFELNGNVQDVSGNGRDATLLGGTFVDTSFGQGLRVGQADVTGLDWSAFAGLLRHSYSIELVLTPDDTSTWRKLFSFDDADDDGWYYKDQGIQAYPNPTLGRGQVLPGRRHYIAFVSTAPDRVDVYFQGVLLGSTNASFTAPPPQAIFFKDDREVTGERLEATVDAVRISSVARSQAEIAAVQRHLGAGTSLAGTVTAAGGGPLSGISVSAYFKTSTGNWEYAGQATTSASGTYVIEGLDSGTFRVYFSDPAQISMPEYYRDAADLASATDVSITAGTATTNVDAVLARAADPLAGATTPTGSVTSDPRSGEIAVSIPRGTPSDVTIRRHVSCPNDRPTNVVLFLDSTAYPMAEVPAGSGFYEATIPVAALESGSLEVRWICRGAPFVVKVGQIVLYDPSGQITDARTGAPISGATVILYRVPGALPDTAGQRRNCRTVNTRGGSDWSKVPDAPIDAGVMVNPQLGVVNATQEISPTINPQITNANGRYGWDVAEGCWYIVVRAQGYVTRTSPIVGVPPAVTDLDIRLTQSPRAVYLPLIVR